MIEADSFAESLRRHYKSAGWTCLNRFISWFLTLCRRSWIAS
jgi:hypothetical protein